MSRSVFAAFLAVLLGAATGASGQTVWHVDYDDDAGGVSIVVDDQQGEYPLTIDPRFEVAKLTASDAAAGDFFGEHVSISGDTAIVGARWNDDAGDGSGSAYIFRRDQGGAGNWGQVRKLTASDAAGGDEFGSSVSVSGDTAIVGADGADDAGSASGSAYIFQRNQGGVDNWGQVKKLTVSDAATHDYFGHSVSISGDTAIVGAWYGDSTVADSGSAYIFRRDQGGADNWGQVKKLTASDAAAIDHFGWSVSLSGDTAIVGTDGNDDAGVNSGSAYIFQRDQGGADNWGQVKKLTASDAAAEDWFGRSVSISGDTAIAGAYGNDDAGDRSGSAYIFRRDQGGADNWGEVKKLTASDGAGGDWFGYSVSVSGDAAIVGAYRDADAGDNSGSAYIFIAGAVHNVTQGTWYFTIQSAINDTLSGDEITVLPGTYKEAIDFLGKVVTLRSGGGPQVTIIDASGLGASVVTCANGEGLDTILDGFTITGGTGTDLSGATYRGGMYNYGAGPTVTNCSFSGNTAYAGGGMYNWSGSPAVVNCTFSGNTAASAGGGMHNLEFSTPAVVNCTFSGNTAGGAGGGGMAVGTFSYPTVDNCVFWGNTSDELAVLDESSAPIVSHSNVRDGWSGKGNIDEDPLFVRAPDPGPDLTWGTDDDDFGDLHVRPGSPCIDAGDNAAVPEGVVTDLDGRPRFLDDPATADTGAGEPPIVDMGAYEYRAGDFDRDGDTDADDLAVLVDCMTGPGVSGTPDCDGVGLDGDMDVDLRDVGHFQAAFETE